LRALGLHITRHGINVSIIDAAGGIVKSWSDTVHAAEGCSGLLRRISAALDIARKHSESRVLQGVGIAVGGMVRGDAISENIPILADWENINLAETARKQTGLPSFVGNDVIVETFAEQHYGKARGVRNAVYFHYGWGLGMGIILDSELRRGVSYAGGICHLKVADFGPICNCGNRGCLESLCSVGALTHAVARAIQEGARSEVRTLAGDDLGKISWEILLAAGDHGDTLVQNVLERASNHLAAALAGVAELLDPELLILGGRIQHSPSFFVESLRRKIFLRLTGPIRRHLRIEVSALGPEAGVIGAGALVFQHLFDSNA
jgi:predicted NBD/HSP70 family sugar kinase